MAFDNNEMMIELFRSEVESHSESLTNALLVLEKDSAATGELVSMMRAAHSIKGAARIVQVSPAVEVAHVMEDCFVAAQRGEILLDSQHVDLLLGGVDLLGKIAGETKKPRDQWNDFRNEVQRIVEGVSAILKRQPLPSQPLAESIKLAQPLDQILPPLAVDETEQRAAEQAVSPPFEESKSGLRLEVGQRMDRRACEEFRQRLISADLRNQSMVVFDFAKTETLEPIAVAFLSACKQYFDERRSQTMKVENLSPRLSRLMDVCGLGSLMFVS